MLGLKLKCDNGKTYIVLEGDDQYEYALVDIETSKTVNLVNYFPLKDALSGDNEQNPICVGIKNGELEYTYVLMTN